MKLNLAYNKSNSFFKDKKAIITSEVINGLDEKIPSGSEVTIIGKSLGLKIYFNIQSEDGVLVNRVSYEYLEIIKTDKPCK